MDAIYVHLMMHDLTNNKLIDSNYSILALDTLYRHLSDGKRNYFLSISHNIYITSRILNGFLQLVICA